jgi:hypothetical protein
VIDDIRDVPAIFDELLASGIQLVKVDTGKLFSPKEWGWRIIAFDLRMPNGQLVEWYLPIRELEAQKKAEGHLLFEEWRNKSADEIDLEMDAYMATIQRSFEGYDKAFQSALDRIGISREEAAASWASAESSMLEAARKSPSSSGMITSSVNEFWISKRRQAPVWPRPQMGKTSLPERCHLQSELRKAFPLVPLLCLNLQGQESKLSYPV